MKAGRRLRKQKDELTGTHRSEARCAIGWTLRLVCDSIPSSPCSLLSMK